MLGVDMYVNGLSPLARGTRALATGLPASVRFIPAGAGNTPIVVVLLQMTPVYPRWRGEHTNGVHFK